jgi:excisionase family DNA binding protein
MAGPMSDSYLSVEQIAEYLGVSKDTVYTWITAKGMPGHRLGRLWKFKKEEVDAWVKSGGAAGRRDVDTTGEEDQ